MLLGHLPNVPLPTLEAGLGEAVGESEVERSTTRP